MIIYYYPKIIKKYYRKTFLDKSSPYPSSFSSILSKRLVFLLKMLIFLKSRKQRKHHMQRLDNIIITLFMNRDIKNITSNSAVLLKSKIDLLAWDTDLREDILDLLWPDLH
jgi:hypothetical protein